MHMISELNTMKYTKLILTLTLSMMASSIVLSEAVSYTHLTLPTNREV